MDAADFALAWQLSAARARTETEDVSSTNRGGLLGRLTKVLEGEMDATVTMPSAMRSAGWRELLQRAPC